jgi:CHAT domain-containing protein
MGPQAEADLAEAEPLIASAIGARHPYVLVLRAEHCFAQIETHAAASSCAALQGLQDVLDEASPRQRFAVRAALAAAAEASGKTQAAREDHLLALAAALDVGGPDPRWSAYDALARHLRRHGERAEAVLIAKQSVAQIEAMRADLAADAGRHERGFLSDKQGVYLRLADWLTEDGRIDEALQVLRMLKREEFFDFVQRDGGLADPGSTPEALLFSAAERQGLAPWIGAPAATPAREGAEPPSAAEREAWRSLARTEAARVRSWQTLLSRLPDPAVASAPPAAAATRPGPPDQPTPPDPAVAPGELRAWIYPGEAHLNLVLASPRGRELRRLPSEPAALARAIGRLLGSIGRREPVDDQLRALHALLGAPLVQAADQAGAQRLVLQVTGVLRYLPFAALTDGQHALGERLAIEQRVDAAEAGPPASRPARAGSVRAFGVTRAVNGMAALPALAREVCGIVDGPVFGLAENDAACAPGSGALPGKAWLNERFTLAELGLASAGLPGQHDLLHLGTHFMLRPGQMSRSWLLLGDGQRLGLDQLATLDFSGQDLVTLSACETGLGGADGTARGQEVEGLNLLVMRRGARAVLASLWRVEDTSTGLLMREFYRGLARRADPAQALRQAQRAVRLAEGGRYAEPFYWAGFYLATRR